MTSIDEDTASLAAPSMAVVHDVAEGSIVEVESVVEAAEGSIVPAESAVEVGVNCLLREQCSQLHQSSPAAPADDAAARLEIATPSNDQGKISCLQLLVTQQQQQITQPQQQITQLLQQGNQGQQQINQQAADIQQLKHEVARLRDDVGKRSSHQDQAASLERANTQLAALGRDVEQLQR